PVITSSGGNFTLSQLTDGDLRKTTLLPRDSAEGYGWIQFEFAQPQTIKAVTMVGGGNPGVFGFGGDSKDSRKLEMSDDGKNFKFICIIPAGAVPEQTIDIPATTSKYFRVTVQNPPPPVNIGAAFGFGDAPAPKDPGGTEIAEIVLHTADRINMFEEKDAFAPVGDLDKKVTAPTNNDILFSDVIDLTDKLNADGSLSWTVPAGDWNILRFGYSLMGINNHPASPEATGLEVDKLDPSAIKRYFTNYLDQYKNATGGLMGSKGGLQYVITDSWEAGAQNWTSNLPQEFRKRRGYSVIPWLPVLTGHIVKSAAASEGFLFDFRKTLAELVAEYHYDGLTKILAERGMKRYSESHESGRALIADGMDVKRTAAIPMSALWVPNPFINQNDQTPHTVDIRESASVAHIYGQNLVAAESLTALGIGGNAWSYCPENLKPSVDLELASGLNRFVIHCSVHQPVDDKIPGLGLGPFGQWYTRHETWAEQATAWNAYLSRSSYLLQQGKFIADIVYYYGEDNNITNLFGKNPPAIPQGYNYDYINADALIHLLSIKDGKLVTPSGMSYRVLVLDSNAVNMSLPVLRKLRDLVKAGATIAGIKPLSTPSLSDDQNEFTRLVNEIWNSSNPKVSSGKSLADLMREINLLPDFSYDKPQNDTRLLFVHRKMADRDIYWVNNRNDRVEDALVTFRITGKVPMLWHAESGMSEQVSYLISNGVTKVNLHLQPGDAVFVVFKDKTFKTSLT
ncbi:MAG TPA: glycosyl hydrolase, partial [Chitinophagaceae bacterium]|nr:glycosyl hydrolase [Chitinophagaceae bacterium]